MLTGKSDTTKERLMSRTRLACALVLLLPPVALAGDFERGLEALEKKDYDKAIACFDAHIKANPRDASGYYMRGVAYGNNRDFDRAIDDFSLAIKLNPKDPDVFNDRGQAYGEKRQFDRALADFAEAIRLDPKHADAHCNRAIVRVTTKEYQKAVEGYTEAIRLDPGHARAYCGLAWVLAACPRDGLRDGKRAVELATKACELSGWEDANCLDTLAAALAESGDFKAAVRRQKQAVEMGSRDEAQAERFRKRLKLYEQGKPYREE
jgi:tetratricopeptide (TPR) repeat protein